MAAILFSFLYPGDETFNCGGSIAKLSRQGHQVSLICATPGEAGLKEELRKAAQVLGITNIYFLGFKDGGWEQMERGLIEAKILSVFKIEKPQVVVTWVVRSLRADLERETMSFCTQQVFRKVNKGEDYLEKLYEVFSPKVLGSNDLGWVTARINIENYWYLKKRALLVYESRRDDVFKIFGPALESGEVPAKFEFFRRIYPEGQKEELTTTDSL